MQQHGDTAMQDAGAEPMQPAHVTIREGGLQGAAAMDVVDTQGLEEHVALGCAHANAPDAAAAAGAAGGSMAAHAGAAPAAAGGLSHKQQRKQDKAARRQQRRSEGGGAREPAQHDGGQQQHDQQQHAPQRGKGRGGQREVEEADMPVSPDDYLLIDNLRLVRGVEECGMVGRRLRRASPPPGQSLATSTNVCVCGVGGLAVRMGA
jgi:hypothetical protein